MSLPRKVLVIGSGPIVIGQAAEFDYAGVQACLALRGEGVETVLVNSNPATVMTDPDVGGTVLIGPLTTAYLEQVIAEHRPDALLPTLGGQTGLNLAVALDDAGILERYGVRVLGTPLAAVRAAEDRGGFRALVTGIGEPVPESAVVESPEEGLAFVRHLNAPVVVRPAFTLGGGGGGFAFDEAEARERIATGLRASPIGQVLVERSLLGWYEIEFEVIRDAADTAIAICGMENVDPMGVHTGDSIVVAPIQTLPDPLVQRLRRCALKIVRALGLEGGCNVQLAVAPDGSDYRVIEVNPRVSRSSALASKATGYPIARVAALVGLGRRLDELPNPATGGNSAAFEPAVDYVVVKLPRWPFDKFPAADRSLGVQMKATGEAMAIDREFGPALLKAIRSLEPRGRGWLWEDPEWGLDRRPPADLSDFLQPTDSRLWRMVALLRHGWTDAARLSQVTGIAPWFTERLAELVEAERGLVGSPLMEAKRAGFGDADIAALSGVPAAAVRRARVRAGIAPSYRRIDTCAGEFPAETPYFYSSYALPEVPPPAQRRSVIVVGSGPIRIGQGIEFDYCSVRAAWAIRSMGYDAVVINNNPETVSTDYDACSRLYFEPLDTEAVLDVIDHERALTGQPPAVVLTFGGQTAIDLAKDLAYADVPIAGLTAEAIETTEDRERFAALMEELGVEGPRGLLAADEAELRRVIGELGWPVIVRPSWVIGGRGIAVLRDEAQLHELLATEVGWPLRVDELVEGIELDVDAMCDGVDWCVPGILEQLDPPGVHSGDSVAVVPPQRLPRAVQERAAAIAGRLALALGVRGILNVQMIVTGERVVVIEANPRASRTVPIVAKATGRDVVAAAVRCALGARLDEVGWAPGLAPDAPLVAVKAPVDSLWRLPGVERQLGPEMRSTGEVLGLGPDYEAALEAARAAAEVHAR
ncbi:MAG TPA: carbamoyl-phosphate synthase large subunit [candidate division Zixibacteria bacterium]|nr:carbamoyl-phosphate synthase large subunit [candidate division Zixibacteria bacterium]